MHHPERQADYQESIIYIRGFLRDQLAANLLRKSREVSAEDRLEHMEDDAPKQ